jgi:hypothetical protein
VNASPGIVDKDIHTAEPLEHCIEDGLHRDALCDVSLHIGVLDATLSQAVANPPGLNIITTDDHHSCARFPEREGEALTQASGPTGDDCHSPGERELVSE